MPVDDELSRAVVVYLDGEQPFPRPDEGRVFLEFGAERAAELAPTVKGLVEQMWQLTADRPEEYVDIALKRVERNFTEMHPELSAEAVERIASYVSYVMR
jgi:hypothetical protein